MKNHHIQNAPRVTALFVSLLACAWLPLLGCGTQEAGVGEADDDDRTESDDESGGGEGGSSAGSGGAGGGSTATAGRGGGSAVGGAGGPPSKGEPDVGADAGVSPMPGDAKDAGVSTNKPDAGGRKAELKRILLFSRTTGYRHGVIPYAVKVFQEMGAANGFAVDQTEDPTKFTDEGLAPYQVVVWLNTTGRPLDTEAQRQAFERFIQRGGGYVGTHSASDTWGGRNWQPNVWPWYGKLLGGDAFFAGHPTPRDQTLKVDDRNTAATRHFPESFAFSDEWYDFQKNPRSVVKVLLSLVDPRKIDHPIAWYHEFDGGRAFYTALGHRREAFEDPRMKTMLLAVLKWAAGGEM